MLISKKLLLKKSVVGTNFNRIHRNDYNRASKYTWLILFHRSRWYSKFFYFKLYKSLDILDYSDRIKSGSLRSDYHPVSRDWSATIGKPKRRRIAERAECEINWSQPVWRGLTAAGPAGVILIRIRELVPGQCSVSSVHRTDSAARLVPDQMSPRAWRHRLTTPRGGHHYSGAPSSADGHDMRGWFWLITDSYTSWRQTLRWQPSTVSLDRAANPSLSPLPLLSLAIEKSQETSCFLNWHPDTLL